MPTGDSLLPGRSMIRIWPLLRGMAWIIVLPVSVVSSVHPPIVAGVAGPTPTKLVREPSPAARYPTSLSMHEAGLQQSIDTLTAALSCSQI